MKLSYNGLPIDELGEFTVSQSREYEEGQRCKVTLKVNVSVFERSYADNYALLAQVREALRVQNGVLVWTNDDTGTDYVNRTVTVLTDEQPEEWGTYAQEAKLTFTYYEQDLVTNNLPLTFGDRSE